MFLLKKNILIVCIFLFICELVCAQYPIIIDIEEALLQKGSSEVVFEEARFIPLETTAESLIDNPDDQYYLTPQHIISVDHFFGNVYIFDRQTGEFIKQVSRRGQGPEEYFFTVGKYGLDEKRGVLLFDKVKEWRGYDINSGKFEKTIKNPLHDGPIKGNFSKVSAPWHLEDDEYVSYVNNISGNDTLKLIIYNSNGNILKLYTNSQIFDKIERGSTYQPGIFYNYDNKTFFIEKGYGDTVYHVNKYRLTPHIIFKRGDKKPEYKYREAPAKNINKIFINDVYETDEYVFFNYYTYAKGGQRLPIKRHTGYYDKNVRKTYLHHKNRVTSGYDINGVLFYPIHINSKGEAIGVLKLEQINEDKSKEILTKNKELKDIINVRQEDDNPIVIVAKIKRK